MRTMKDKRKDRDDYTLLYLHLDMGRDGDDERQTERQRCHAPLHLHLDMGRDEDDDKRKDRDDMHHCIHI